MRFVLFTLLILFGTASATFADPNPYNIATSKAYVDTKQTKVPAGTNGSLVTHSGTDGTFGTPRAVATSLGSGTPTDANSVPTSGAVVSKFNTSFPAQNTGGNVVGNVVTLTSTVGAPSATDIVSTVTSGGTKIPTDGAVFDAFDTKSDIPRCTNTSGNKCYTWTFGAASSCLAVNETCQVANDQCCDGTYCYGLKTSGECKNCANEGDGCFDNRQCCGAKGLSCLNGVCTLPSLDCAASGEECAANKDCCSGMCVKKAGAISGKCNQAIHIALTFQNK